MTAHSEAGNSHLEVRGDLESLRAQYALRRQNKLQDPVSRMKVAKLPLRSRQKATVPGATKSLHVVPEPALEGSLSPELRGVSTFTGLNSPSNRLLLHVDQEVSPQATRTSPNLGLLQRRHPDVPLLQLQSLNATPSKARTASASAPKLSTATRCRSTSAGRPIPRPVTTSSSSSRPTSIGRRDSRASEISAGQAKLNAQLVTAAATALRQVALAAKSNPPATASTAASRRRSTSPGLKASPSATSSALKSPGASRQSFPEAGRTLTPSRQRPSTASTIQTTTAGSTSGRSSISNTVLQRQASPTLRSSPTFRPPSRPRTSTASSTENRNGNTKEPSAPQHRSRKPEVPRQSEARIRPSLQANNSTDSLAEAATALRKIIPFASPVIPKVKDAPSIFQPIWTPVESPVAQGSRKGVFSFKGASSLVTHDMASDDHWMPLHSEEGITFSSPLLQPLRDGSVCSPVPPTGHAVDIASTAYSPSAVSGCYHASSTTDERMRQLILENQALREAFSDTQKRLMKLEDEKRGFMDEGIYDVVNSICGHAMGSRPMRMNFNSRDENVAECMHSQGAITFSLTGSSDVPIIEPCPNVLSPSAILAPLALSPESAAITIARRNEEERRSAELSGENDELRRELARASEVGEALEQQKIAAEDRVHTLEQEHLRLREHLTQLATGICTGQLDDISPTSEYLPTAPSAEGLGDVTEAVGMVQIATEALPDAAANLSLTSKDDALASPDANVCAISTSDILGVNSAKEPYELEEAW